MSNILNIMWNVMEYQQGQQRPIDKWLFLAGMMSNSMEFNIAQFIFEKWNLI